MATLSGILSSAITLGAIYAASSVSLALLWGSIRMLNLAHGAFIVAGAYGSVILVTFLGLPWWCGLLGGVLGGALGGLVVYLGLVRWVFGRPGFDLKIIILTMAMSTIAVDMINNLIGPRMQSQPFRVDGRFDFLGLNMPLQTLLVVAGCGAMVVALQLIVEKTSLGRLIRAVSQDMTAAQLNGIPVQWVVLQVIILAGVVAGLSGVFLTTFTTVYPTAGFDPLLKALIVCVVGGLGSIPGALIAAFLLALIEATVQYTLGVKWGFPVLLLSVVVVLTYFPNGLFGRQELVRN
ncbi:branched-chain amino acid ABC transporter permease [Methyloligella solikamskensis]|uniref:Branched-chain amino acid ABC transporter permease n=1 Tax=Methyloligella solikamskensis TaxID=1177756 RepID=A0ABW3J813_9HYPH